MRLHNMLGSWVIAAGATVLAMTGCGKHPAASSAERAGSAAAAPLVAEAERSAHFAAVAAQLELGGTLFGYVDIDGDVAKLAEGLQNLAAQATQAQPMAAAFLPKDFAAVFQDLGFADVKALGLSSVAEAGGTFRNRAFFYTPEGRRGLLAGLGGEPREFTVARLAPADADVVFESEVDAPAVYSAIRAVIVRVAGEPMAAFVDAKLKQPDPNSPISPMDAIEALKGRISLALRVDETRSFLPQPGVTIPAFDIALRFEHGGGRLQTLFGEAARAAGVKRGERADGVVVYSAPEPLPFMDWEPEAWVDGDAVTLVSRGAFLSGAGAKLADDATFRAALAQVGDKGNGLSYIGPRLAERARRVLELNPDLPLEQRQAVERVLQLLPAPGEPVVFLRQNLPDGVLFRSRSQASQKQNLVLANPGVIMTTGLVAAMAIPAFQKVRATSQEKAVLNNLRQLSAASEQYFLENGKASCTYADLVGPGRDKYIRQMTPVAGEDYTAMTFSSDDPHLSVVLADGRVVEYTRR